MALPSINETTTTLPSPPPHYHYHHLWWLWSTAPNWQTTHTHTHTHIYTYTYAVRTNLVLLYTQISCTSIHLLWTRVHRSWSRKRSPPPPPPRRQRQKANTMEKLLRQKSTLCCQRFKMKYQILLHASEIELSLTQSLSPDFSLSLTLFLLLTSFVLDFVCINFPGVSFIFSYFQVTEFQL